MNAQHQPRQCTCELCWPNIADDPAPVNEQENEVTVAPTPESEEATVAMAV